MEASWPLPLSDWIEDETLFGLCSRIHVLTGNVFSHATSQALFGHPRRGTQHDFPAHLESFVQVTRGQLGDATDLVERTLLPYFLLWKPKTVVQKALSQVRTSGVGAMKFHLGIASSRFRAHFPLKACDACMEQDVKAFGVACWHLQHQYPGVWMCVRHVRPLRESLVKSTGVGRFLWCLPSDSDLSPAPRLSEESSRALLALAVLTNDSMKSITPHGLSSDLLAHAYSTVTIRMKAATTRSHMRELGAAYACSVEPLRAIPELAPLAQDAWQGLSQVQPILSGRRWNTHPLRHLTVILWLFGSWKAFEDSYCPLHETANAESDVKTDVRNPENVMDTRRGRLVEALSRGASATAAAKIAGVTVNTAIAWAAKAGIATENRPKRTQPSTRKEIIEALSNGDGKRDVAARYAVSEQAVTRILQAKIGLQDEWHEAVLKGRSLSARRQWSIAMKQNPDASRKTLRIIAPAAFAWLYRNDRAWLIEQQSKAPPAPRRIRSTVDWVERDVALARCVEEAALGLYRNDPSARITLQRLYQVIPELKRRLGKLSRLPLTRARIDRATAKQSRGSLDLPMQ